MSIGLILLAGGTGSRMNSKTPKQFLQLGDKPIALHSLEIFEKISDIREIVVVAAPEWRHLFPHIKKFALPGGRRQDSVYNGLQALSNDHEWVLTHDSARPFLTVDMVHRLIEEGKKSGAATLGVPVKPTIKEIKTTGHIEKTLDRSKLVEIQTPQMLRRKTLEKGFSIAIEKYLTLTDDTSFAELLGEPVKVVTGHYSNIKITTSEDFHFAKELVKK